MLSRTCEARSRQHLQFSAGLRGQVIEPADASYDAARKVYNAMIDKRPRLIVQCRDVSDVISAVDFARENSLEVSIRSGGHHGAGLSLVNFFHMNQNIRPKG